MKFVGSKNKLSKELAPIIQSYIDENTKGYIEICVGGGNMIDKINHHNKLGFDIHEELIELLKYAQDLNNELPTHITEEEYIKVRDNKENYPKWYVGLVGFCASFGAKYFNGYARSFKSDGITPRDMSNEAIRNLENQRANLKDIKFKCIPFQNIPKDKLNGYVIYADIPYRNSTKYKTEEFPYDEFYKWCAEVSKNNTVLISEYNMPNNFECIWSKETKVLLDSNKSDNDYKNIRVEKLFRIRKE